MLGAKAKALLAGRAHVTRQDIRDLVVPAFRHRVLVSYKAEAEGITVDHVIQRILEQVPEDVAT